MNIEDKVKEIYKKTCKQKENYTTEEIINITDEVLMMEEIKSNFQALKIIEKIAKESVSGLTTEQIEKAKKADQKWLNISGNTYEKIIEKENNIYLEDSCSKFYFPKKVKEFIDKGELINNEKDTELLKKWIKGKTFDLYIVKKQEEGYVVFSVVQCKKSIRERVARDREPSIKAMNAGFFSILISLNDECLGKETTKMRKMFTGDDFHYSGKGWDYAYFEKLSLATNNIKHKSYLINDIKEAEKNYKKTCQ